ncbi:MAG: HNH endonuclease [Planctomycetota bacterium]|jgi:hypothetical protein
MQFFKHNPADDKVTLSCTFKAPSALVKLCIHIALIYRRLRYGYTFRRIPLSRDKFAIVDPEDFDKLIKYKWNFCDHKGLRYAKRWQKRKPRGTNIPMHRQIIGVPDGMCVDHINHNGLDNRKANLRIATHAQNTRNRIKTRRKCSSKYIGVHWVKHAKKFQARITAENKRINLGYFSDETQAAKAYDKAAKILHDPFASLNFPG